MNTNIPRTGRIGRFAKIIEQQVDPDTLQRIMHASEDYKSLKPIEKAEWWRSAVERLEDEVGEYQAVEIMKACGRKCCGQGNRAAAKRLMLESDSLEEFLSKASAYGVKDDEIEYKLQDENTIIGHFYRCFCGQVKRTKTPFDNLTFCHCSAEFHKQFFEAALEQSVTVEIRQSIISGAENCEFVIHINE